MLLPPVVLLKSALPAPLAVLSNAAGGVVSIGERISTIGRVVVAGGVALERLKTDGRVHAGGVVKSALNPWPSCVPVVLIEAPENRWPVVDAACVANERTSTNGRVVLPVVLLWSAMEPMAVLLAPVVRLKSASVPSAVLRLG